MKPSKEIRFKKQEKAMSLVEILIVLMIMAFLFQLVSGQLRSSNSKIKVTLKRLKKDLETSSNAAIVSGKVHRIVFDLKANNYWLEQSDYKNFDLSNFKRDPSQKKLSEKEEKEKREEELKEYEDLLGEKIKDNDGKEIPLPSPVLVQLKKRKPIKGILIHKLPYQVYG